MPLDRGGSAPTTPAGDRDGPQTPATVSSAPRLGYDAPHDGSRRGKTLNSSQILCGKKQGTFLVKVLQKMEKTTNLTSKMFAGQKQETT